MVTPSQALDARRLRRALRAAGLVALPALLAGAAACASVHRIVDSYDMAPSGLTSNEERLRRTLALGRYDSALVRASKKELGAPGDRLLRDLYGGLVAYYAGEYDRSAAEFDHVWQLTDDRLTRSATREAASLVANDRTLPWKPSPTERLLARHYAMLGYLRKGDVPGAAVEARRLVQTLQELDDAGTPVDARTRALLDYTAAAVFEQAGERNDADVSRRNAAALGLEDPPRPEHDDSATVLVLVEHGFVAHKVEQSLSLAFGTRDEIAAYADDDGRRAHDFVISHDFAKHDEDDDDRDTTEAARADSTLKEARRRQKRQAEASGLPGMPSGTPVMPGARTAGGTRAPERAPSRAGEGVGRPRPSSTPASADAGSRGPRHERTRTVDVVANATPVERLFGLLVDQEHDEWYADQWDRPMIVRTAQSTGYLLTLAWPTFARPEPAPAPMAVSAWHGDDMVASDMPVLTANLSDAVVADFRRQRAAIFTRAVARAATKYWIAERAEKKKKWAGVLVNGVGELLERADTRSWHLLPGEISLVRLRLPAGTHNVTVDVSDARRPSPSHVELGPITVAAGETRVLTGRVWAARLSRAPLPGPVRTAASGPAP